MAARALSVSSEEQRYLESEPHINRWHRGGSAYREVKELFRLAWPTSLSILFHYMIQPISLAFCGHVGRTQLAAAALALSVIFVTCVSVGRGLAFGADTFFSQTFGSRNKTLVGVYLQRSVLFALLVSFPIWALMLNAERILLSIGQDPSVSRLAQEYLLLFMPAVPAYGWLFILMRYLLCQNIVYPNLVICIVSSGLNALLHYGLVIQAGMGIRGSAISLMLTYYLVLFQLIAYIWASGIHAQTWTGWSWRCLDEWDSFGRVVFSSVFMTVIFWFSTEVGTFLAGALGDRELSAFSITFQVEGIAWMVPLGLGSACTARVGQYLGANRPRDAKTAYVVAMAMQVVVSLVMATATYLLRDKIPRVYTTDTELVSLTSSLLKILTIFVLLEGVGGVGVSIVRGTGRHALGAVIIFVSYYVVALPIGIPLMFATYLRLNGLWWGYVAGIVVQAGALAVFTGTLNWEKEADKAQVRAGLHDPNEPNGAAAGGVVNEVIDSGAAEEIDESTPFLPRPPSSAPLRAVLLRRAAVVISAILTLAAGVVVRHYTSVTYTS